MAAYYNEIDPGAAAWLRQLIKDGLIADGEVDERSILNVRPVDLRGFTQCHFFAGIGGWSCALRLAGWPDDRPCWTGSPPCQPFSAAGKQRGRDDARHLAPHFIDLVRSCRPRVLFGEQVASSEVFGKAAGGAGKRAGGPPAWAWIDDLSDRLEAARYAVGASDFPSAGVGAPHIRQRTFFGAVDLADADDAGLEGWREPERERGTERPAGPSGVAGGLADSDSDGCGSIAGRGLHDAEHHSEPRGGDGGLADPSSSGRRPEWKDSNASDRLETICAGQTQSGRCRAAGRTSPLHGFWSDADWLFCRDGKWRPVEPGTFPLADGVSGRVGLLRGYGNAINPHAAKGFIQAFDTAATMKEAI
ncbi:DNA cytosine methyltransferase [Paracoccus sp. SM22M-07]|uniref:DNA cytosine methyltransferase n=1 Tax=Paracoccus sp. SM22M-07 TaxID=1520813 RepID=UPI0009311A29|nr:DNA cytosine methyltransferase [Paracoccus sp. SM22M-07]